MQFERVVKYATTTRYRAMKNARSCECGCQTSLAIGGERRIAIALAKATNVSVIVMRSSSPGVECSAYCSLGDNKMQKIENKRMQENADTTGDPYG